MKIQVLAASLALAAVFVTSCEQHDWSSTKKLYSHGDKDHGHGDDHKGHDHDHSHDKDHAGDGEKKEEKH
ncbi:hypothetical protein [Phragmitibacter flavus]|nr:hypothetical protein [Phragmitibacter flavus]